MNRPPTDVTKPICLLKMDQQPKTTRASTNIIEPSVVPYNIIVTQSCSAVAIYGYVCGEFLFVEFQINFYNISWWYLVGYWYSFWKP